MLRLTRLIVVLPALFVALPTMFAADPPTEDPKERAKLVQKEFIAGKLTESSFDGEEKTFTVTVTEKVSVLNNDNNTKMNTLKQQLSQAVASAKGKPNPNIQNLNKQISDLQAKLYDQVDVNYEFQCKNAKTFYLRRKELPKKEGGAKYTPEEITKLRGEVKGLDGYTAEAPDFEKDSLVHIWLDRNRLPPTTKKKDDPAPTYYVKMVMLMPPPKEDKKDPPKK